MVFLTINTNNSSNNDTSYNDDNLINSNINVAIYLDELNKKKLNNNNPNYNPNHNSNHNSNHNPNYNYFDNRNYSNDEINCDSKSRLLPRSISNVNFMTSKYFYSFSF